MSANLKSLLRPRITSFLMASLAVVVLSGCATAPADPAARAEFEAENDPLEPMNRAVFAFNVQMDKMFLKPAGIIYRETLPQPVRTGVGNFLSNLRSPVVLANDLLQGEIDRAGNTASRFVINTTVGVLGVWDAASHFGIRGHSEDFGQTFGVWGVGEGFYLVLPLFGPSNPRDALGLAIEYYVDPFNLWMREENIEGWIFARSLVTGIDYRSRNLEVLDEIERTSLDYYVAIRSLYRQRRMNEINNGEGTSDEFAPGISLNPPEKMPARSDKSANAL